LRIAMRMGAPAMRANRRRARRRRTRLRSGKVCTLDDLFLADCLIFDRSPMGVRIRLAQRTRLPELVKFFDDELRLLKVARIAWRRGNEVGMEFPGDQPRPATCQREITRLSGKYYAMRRARLEE